MNTKAIQCFVPDCFNKKTVNDRGNEQRLHFFQVPSGIEGFFWEKAVRIRKQRYDKMIDLLTSTDYMLGLDDVNKTVTVKHRYCCEVHFDIDTDIDRVVDQDGLVDYIVKPGRVPQIKPKQKKRLCDYYELAGSDMINDAIKTELTPDEMVIHSTNVEECHNEARTNGYVSVVDISTLINKKNEKICYNLTTKVGTDVDDNEPIMPMLPLTIAMIKRKSFYYTGLKRTDFLKLLELSNQKHISDVKVMITLRKLQLNEEFEALGDLFDLDMATTEKYFHESKLEVTRLVDMLGTCTETVNHIDHKSIGIVSETQTVDDPMLTQLPSINYSCKATNVINKDDLDQFYTSSSETSETSSCSTYEPSERDPDVNTDDFLSASDDDLAASDDDFLSASEKPVKGEKTEFCHLCNEWFTTLGIDYHIRTAHTLGRNLNKTTCGLCLQQFATNDLLQSHQKDVHDGNAFGCDLCDKQTRRKRVIVGHILKVHAKLSTYLCDECGVGFPFPVDLKKHIRAKHHPNYRFKCNFCELKYRTGQNLRDHLRSVHTRERPFKCKFDGCGKAFSRKSSLGTHRRVHATDKFECEICSKQFSFKGNLTAHKRNIHGMSV